MEDIRAFILPKEDPVEEEKEEKIPKAKPAILYETVFASGPDFAVRRKTARTSSILVVLVSQRQYYIKNETGGGTIEGLNEESMRAFCKDIPDGGFPIRDESGNAPSWISDLERDKTWRTTLMTVLRNDKYYEYIKSGMINFCDLLKEPYNTKMPEGTFAAHKFVYELIAEAAKEAGRNTEKYNVSIFNNLFKNMFQIDHRYGKNAKDIPSAYDQLMSLWGHEGVRKFVHLYFETPVTNFPCGTYLERIRIGKDRETNFSLQSMAEYMFCECTKQGFADDPSNFWINWADYLDQQIMVYGEVRDKYSEHLSSDHHVLTYKVNALKRAASIENFAKASETLQKYEYTGAKYCIVAPKTPEEVIDEGRQLSHCVGQYVDQIANGETFVFFCRRKSAKDTSLVTVQTTPDGRLLQARGRFNHKPSEDVLDFIDRWIEKMFTKAA